MREPLFRQYLSIVRRRIWAVVTAFIIVSTLGIINAYKATPIYSAMAKILIETSSKNPVQSERESYVTRWVDPGYYETQKELVRSRAVLEKAIARPEMQALFGSSLAESADQSRIGKRWNRFKAELGRTATAVLGLAILPTRAAEPWEELRDQVKAETAPNNSRFVFVQVESADPAYTATVANAVASAFAEYNLERQHKATSEAFVFLQEQKVKQEQELLKAESALQQFREQSQCISLDVSDKESPVFARHKRLNDQLTEAQLQRIQLEAQVKVVKEVLKSGNKALKSSNEQLFSLPAVRADASVSGFRTNLWDTEREVATLSNTQGPESAQLQAAQIKLRLAQEKLQESLGQLTESLNVQLEMLSGLEDELEKKYEEQSRLALDLSKEAFRFDRLQTEVIRQRKQFDILVERMREVNLVGDFAKTNVDVVEPAVIPTVPVRPNKPRMVWLALFLGLFAGVGLAFFIECMDDTVKTPDDLEDKVGVPVLGFVPDMSSSRNGATDAVSHRGRVSLVEPKSSVTEAYRSIRTSLYFTAPPDDTKVLAITSSGPRDGKTTTATNLALVVAQSGKRVLLVDADFRRPMIHRIFGLDDAKGFSTVLSGDTRLSESVQKVKYEGRAVENLDVLVGGPKPANPAELLDSATMRKFVEEARAKYDRVIMDTPPVLFVADATIVSAICDGVLLVVKAAKNSRSVAVKAREQLEGVKARIIGGILNDVYVSKLGYYYSYYYHYYPYSRYYRDYYHSYYATEGDEAERKAPEQSES